LPSSSWLGRYQLQYPRPVENFICYRYTWQVRGTVVKSTYSKPLILHFHISYFRWCCSLFNGPSQMPIKNVSQILHFPGFCTIFRWAPQKCKIGVLLYLIESVLSEVSLNLCSCKVNVCE
jgi:hypothetical protein